MAPIRHIGSPRQAFHNPDALTRIIPSQESGPAGIQNHRRRPYDRPFRNSKKYHVAGKDPVHTYQSPDNARDSRAARRSQRHASSNKDSAVYAQTYPAESPCDSGSSGQYPEDQQLQRATHATGAKNSTFPCSPQRPLASRPEPLELDDLTCIRSLGQGGFAEVLLVRVDREYEDSDSKMDQPGTLFACKCIRKAGLRASDLEDPGLKHLERAALSQLPWNPFIAGLINVLDDEENIYLTLELIPGGSLYDHIKKRGPFDLDAIRFYMANIICGLDFLHNEGFVHRDVKSENILMGLDGYLCLADFSYAKKEEDQSNWKGIGTPYYSAPEIIKPQGKYSRAVDWWAVGVVLYEMLTRRLPFPGREIEYTWKRIQRGKYTWPAGLNVDPQVKDLVSRLLEHKAEKRLGRHGAEEVMNHPWFKGINWRRMRMRRLMAPFIPPDPNLLTTYHHRPLPRQKRIPGLRIEKPPLHRRYQGRNS